MKPQDRARHLRPYIVKGSASLTDTEALQAVELFPHWDSDSHAYAVGDRVSYEATLYKCLQAHTSQASWNPADAPSLWVRVDDPSQEWPEWRQPTGSTDAYAKGAKVSHNEKHWISDVDNNVWEPSVYGWTEAIE